MKSKLQQISRQAVPALLAALLAGCATTSDVENLQKQVNEVRTSASNANATANSASATAHEAKAIPGDARNTANAASAKSAEAEKFSSNASGFAAAAVKSSEAAVEVAVQAQRTVNEVTVAIPWMRLDPATGRFFVQWIVLPCVGEDTGAAQAPAGAPPAAAPHGRAW